MAAVDIISGRIIGAAIEIHRRYGPGLLETVYLRSLNQELVAAGMYVEMQKPVGLQRGSLTVQRAYVLDLLVERQVIVEVKSITQIVRVHHAQLLTYLKLTGLQLGLIINFNVPRLVDGIKRIVNNYKEEDTDAPPPTE